MAKVDVEIEEVTLENEDGREVDGVQATCGRCGHQTDSYGTSEASRRRCLALLREECPEEENNWYCSSDE